MPAIFGITVPWSTRSTDNEHHSNLAEDTSPQADDTEPLLPPNASADHTNTYNPEYLPADTPYTTDLTCSKQKSASDMAVPTQTDKHEANTESAQLATKIERRRHPFGDAATSPRAHLQLPRPPARRSVSNSLLEVRSRYRESVDTPTSDEVYTAARGVMAREHTFKPKRSRSTKPLYPEPQRPGTNPESHSSHDHPTIEALRQNSCQEKPLKTCLKQKPNSATSTPTREVEGELNEPIEKHKLRRVKTVDFQTSKPLVCTPPPAVTETPSNQETPISTPRRRSSACPSTFNATKGGPADPAVTRTDVHVIAISPSLNRALKSAQISEDVDPATPTMQVMESGNGMYEVVWDDVPAEGNCQKARRGSCAVEALGATSSTAVKGLERVNTKLSEWSGSWNGPSNSFKPTIVVYPDDDGCSRHTGTLLDDPDDERDTIGPPPNSARTSAMQSRRQSRPTSASLSRKTSEEEVPALSSSRRTPSTTPSEKPSHAGPDQDVWSDHLVAARGRLEDSKSTRRPPEYNGNESLFRGHRDSLTIARDRLSKAMGTASRELYARKDSIALAKKRMHGKDRAASGARKFHESDDTLDLGIQGHHSHYKNTESQARRRMRCESSKSGP